MSENIEGMKALLKVLDNMPKNAEKIIPQVIEANMMEMEAEAKRLAPVDTGKLQQSIKQSVPISDKGKGFSRVLESNATGLAPYDKFIEFGTRFMRSQPFLFPAFFKQQPIFIKDLTTALKKLIK